MTSLNSDHRIGIKVREESHTHNLCAHADNANSEIQSTSNSTETIARVLHVDSPAPVRDLINGSVNSSVSLTEDFVNFTFSFPKSYFTKLWEEMKKMETMAIESTSNSSEQSDCLKSQSKGTSNCTNMNTLANQDLSNIHEIMKSRENVTCEFPKGVGSSNDTASVESEDERQASSEMIENCKSTSVKRTLTTTSNNHKNLDAFENYRNVQIKLEPLTDEETDDCGINNDLIEYNVEVVIISEDDSQNVQTLGITNENVNIVENNFDESSSGKNDAAEREATLTTETLTTGSGINRQECIDQIHTQKNIDNINQTSIETLNIVEIEESKNGKCSPDSASLKEDTHSSQININFNKSKLEESQSMWQDLFPLQKIKKIHTKEIKFETSVHHTEKYFEFEILKERGVVKVMAKPDADISVEVVTLNSLESLEIPPTYKNILDKEENVQNSDKLLGLIDPNEECHMLSEYRDKIVNPNVESGPETVKESNAEADNIIPIDFTDIETDFVIAKNGIEISNTSLDVYLNKSTADESYAETGLKIVRKSSVSELSSEPGVVKELESELIPAEESPEAESELSALNESSKIKPNPMESVDFMEYDVYPADVKDKLHDTKIRREYPDVQSDLLEGSEIPEVGSVSESMNDFTTGESDPVAPTDSPKSVLNFAKEGPDSITRSVTSGESRPEADRDTPDGKSKTVTKKISPRNEFDKMQPCEFSYEEPVSVLASVCPEHAIVPVTRNTLQGNVFPSVEVCLGDSVSENVNVLDEKQNKNCANKLQENKSVPICANELSDIKSEPPTYCEDFEESDLQYVAQLPECEIIKFIANKVGTIESINNISESQTDADSEHSSLNLQFSPDGFGNNENEDIAEEICELYEVCSPHEALSEQNDDGTEIKQNSSHKREQFTKHKLQKIENFGVEDSKLGENETSFLSVDPRTFSNFNTSPLKSGTNGGIDIASNICENESLPKIETESVNSEHVHDELENDIKKQVASRKGIKKTSSENKVGVKVETTKKLNKGSKIAKGIPKVFSSNLLSDEVDTAPTRLRIKHYPATSLAKDVIPENSQVSQDKTRNVFGKDSKDKNSEDSSTSKFPLRRSLRSRSQDPTTSTFQNIKKPDTRSQRSSGDAGKISKSFSQSLPKIETESANSEHVHEELKNDIKKQVASLKRRKKTSENEVGVERSVTRKKQVQTPDIKLKEHIAVASRSTPIRSTRYNVLDQTQSEENQESNSTPKKRNIRTSNRTASASKSKERPILSTSTTSASTRSNVNTSTTTTRKTRGTKD